MNSRIFRTGTVFALAAVVLGAFGAHAIKAKVGPGMLEIWHTAVEYQFYHALALLVVSLKRQKTGRNLQSAAVLFILGILLFSGSLYAMVMLSLSGGNFPRFIGLLTPCGGLCFIAGWLTLLFSIDISIEQI